MRAQADRSYGVFVDQTVFGYSCAFLERRETCELDQSSIDGWERSRSR